MGEKLKKHIDIFVVYKHILWMSSLKYTIYKHIFEWLRVKGLKTYKNIFINIYVWVRSLKSIYIKYIYIQLHNSS